MPSKPKEKICPGCDQPMLPKGMKKKPMQYDHAQGCPLDPKAKRKPVPSDTERLDWLRGHSNITLRIDDPTVRYGIREESYYPAEDLREKIEAAIRAARRKR